MVARILVDRLIEKTDRRFPILGSRREDADSQSVIGVKPLHWHRPEQGRHVLEMLVGDLRLLVAFREVNRLGHCKCSEHDRDRFVHQMLVAGFSRGAYAVDDEARCHTGKCLVLSGIEQRPSNRDVELGGPPLARHLSLEQMDEIRRVEDDRGLEQGFEVASRKPY